MSEEISSPTETNDITYARRWPGLWWWLASAGIILSIWMAAFLLQPVRTVGALIWLHDAPGNAYNSFMAKASDHPPIQQSDTQCPADGEVNSVMCKAFSLLRGLLAVLGIVLGIGIAVYITQTIMRLFGYES